MSESKVKIIHYLNKRLKPSFRNGAVEYPVYVRVSYGRKNERLKSVWIIHPCSENDFMNDSRIIELMTYESEIINDIIQSANNDDYILSARLGHSKVSIIDIFLDSMFTKNEIKSQVINYICNKSNISKSILNPFFKFDNLNADQWKELIEKDIFTEATKERIKYLYLLLKYEDTEFLVNNNLYELRAGNFFVYHEWKNKNKSNLFLKFALNEKILPKESLFNITKEFDHILQIYSKIDIAID